MHISSDSSTCENYYRIIFDLGMQVLGRLSELNKVTSAWIHGHQEIPGNEEGNILAKGGDIEVSLNQFTAVPFSVGKKLIKKHLELQHQVRWAACIGRRQSKMLMRNPLHGRANELLAMSGLRLWAALDLLPGHTTQRAHLHKLGHTERQECRLCEYDKDDCVHIVCDCLVLACNRYRIWGSMFLKPEDLENVRVSSLLSLVANTGLGLVS
jgi:hypothetical protein